MKKSVLIFFLLLFLFCASAAAEDGMALLTVEDVFTLACPEGSQIVTHPWNAQDSRSNQDYYASLTVPGEDGSVEIRLFLKDVRETTAGFSAASVNEEEQAEMIDDYLKAYSDLKYTETFSENPGGIPVFLFRSIFEPKRPAYQGFTYIRGWQVQLLCQPVREITSGKNECLSVLRQVLGTLKMLPGTVIESCVSVFDQVTFDCPAGWVFSREYVDDWNDPDNNQYHFGVLYHEGNMLEINASRSTGRKKPKDFSERTKQEIQEYALDKTREANSAGIRFTYQYTFTESESGLPFVVFYWVQNNLDYYAAVTIHQGTELWVYSYSISDGRGMEATELEDLETVLSTCRLMDADPKSGE